MNLFKLSLSYIRRRKLTTLLNVLLLALGVATIVVLLLFSRQFEDNLTRNGKGIDLVVGAKGSPLQLILSSIFHLDVPTGNVALTEVRKIVSHPAVRTAIPLAMGDSYAGYRIVGVTPEYLQHYGAEIAAGNPWHSSLEVVVGAAVAAEGNIAIGDKLVSVHGLSTDGHAHGDKALTVSGILAPTGSVLDRLILTSIKTVWDVHAEPGTDDHEDEDAHEEEDSHHEHEEGGEDHHGHEDEDELAENPAFPVFGRKSSLKIQPADTANQLTAVLISYSSPIAAVTFPRLVNGQTTLQAASPAFETTRLFSLLGVGLDAFRAFALILIVSAALSIFVALYSALRDRRYDLAMMRTLGASRLMLFLHVLLEGLLLAGLGGVLGLLLGHLATEMIGNWFAQTRQMAISGMIFDSREYWLLGGALLIGAIAALLPAIQAYRTEISQTLAEN